MYKYVCAYTYLRSKRKGENKMISNEKISDEERFILEYTNAQKIKSAFGVTELKLITVIDNSAS
jgi:uncharacterized SAM-binding protein YcdF (DUF218 family)